jgi:hypothetical protein
MATTVPVDESPAGVDPSAERTTSSVPAPLVLTKFFIYETIARVYIVGTDELQQRFRILKLGHSSAGTLQAHCDRTEYGAVEFQRLLLALHEGNAGGCKMVSEARGVVGTIRLLSTVFLVLVKQASCVGELGSHQVFRAEALDFFPLTHPDVGGERPVTLDDTEDIDTTIRHQSADEADVEAKYEALLRGIEAKDFIFSYTYALHLRMQHSFSGPASPYSRRTAGKPEEVAQDALLYVWNSYMLDQMDGGVSAATLEGRGGGAAVLLSSGFGLGLVCGSFHQRRVSLLGLPLCLTLLSRRSSEFKFCWICGKRGGDGADYTHRKHSQQLARVSLHLVRTAARVDPTVLDTERDQNRPDSSSPPRPGRPRLHCDSKALRWLGATIWFADNLS